MKRIEESLNRKRNEENKEIKQNRIKLIEIKRNEDNIDLGWFSEIPTSEIKKLVSFLKKKHEKKIIFGRLHMRFQNDW